MLTGSVSVAFAAEAPQFQSHLSFPHLFATRANIAVLIEGTGAEGTWHAEYAPAENGHEPTPTSPSWTLAGTGSLAGISYAYLTSGEPGVDRNTAVLHHLEPATTYYARFNAETTEHQTALSKVFEFTTKAVSHPEVVVKGTDADEHPLVGAEAEQLESTRPFSPTSAAFKALIESNGAETAYHFEYSPPEGGHAPAVGSASWKPFTSAAEGSITPAEDFAEHEAVLSGLTPETTYYVRVKASNAVGGTVVTKFREGPEFDHFTTPTAKPIVYLPEFRNVTASSVHFAGGVEPHHAKTEWQFEYSTEPANPVAWSLVPGGGTVSQDEAETLPEDHTANVEGSLAGLQSAQIYYVRLSAKNGAGDAQGPAGAAVPVAQFETSGPPTATTFATHALHGEALRLLGAVDPHSEPTKEEQQITVEGAPTGGTFTLTFDGQATAPIAFDAASQSEEEGEASVERALEALPALSRDTIAVYGPRGGPYTLVWTAQVDQPQIEGDGSGLTPSTSIAVSTTQRGGVADDTHYHFEYIALKQFEAEGGSAPFKAAGATSTPEQDAGSGVSQVFVGADLPTLQAGETYLYRLVAANTSGAVDGGERSLTVPPSAPVVAAGACSNQALRTGLSAGLPDCRAYEQLTPPDKEGAQEIFGYGGGIHNSVLVGEDGEQLMLSAPVVSWGAGPGAGQSPYFFSRTSSGWRTTAGAPQPETGVKRIVPEIFSPQLTQLGFEADTFTSIDSESAQIEYRAGPPGGPYVTVATVPRTEEQGGWVGASPSFTKLILAVSDRELIAGHPTGTHSGLDLYEYESGELRQVNVNSEGDKLGSCGAKLANAHSLSSDGARVFFEAVPGNNCSAEPHLYIRIAGRTTTNIGAYSFLGANSAGTEIVVFRISGEAHEVFLYQTESATLRPLLTVDESPGAENAFTVSEDFSAVYFEASTQVPGTEAPPASSALGAHPKNLYRYDLATGKLSFLVQADTPIVQAPTTGRYYYFDAGIVSGVPGGAQEAGSEAGRARQLYRYDSSDDLVQCISCASPTDPEPKLPVADLRAPTTGGYVPTTGAFGSSPGPPRRIASANGDYVFFDTPAALIPSDTDGEQAPDEDPNSENPTFENYSVSSDVYEWRAAGIDGCSAPQGCLALLTDGSGGYLNLFLGSADEGRDVFISTDSQLLPRDNDTAADIYDVRIGGGFLEPARSVECAGDACSTPFAPPGEVTPSSFTFTGAGDLVSAAAPRAAKKKAAPGKKKKAKMKPTKKKKKTRKARAKKTSDRRRAQA